MSSKINDFLQLGIDKGGFNNDDLVAIFNPLLERIAVFHTEDKVAKANFIDEIEIENDVFYLDDTHFANPIKNWDFLNINKKESLVDIIEELELEQSIGNEVDTSINRVYLNQKIDDNTFESKLLPNFRNCEIEAGHHDALSDILTLGTLLASFALNLPIRTEENALELSNFKEDLTKFNPSLHPVIANTIQSMIQLDRSKRASDLLEIIDNLNNYRNLNYENDIDVLLKSINDKKNRKTIILSRLKSKLFDLTRRNKMLYFQPGMKLLNLTYASIPQVLNLNYIKEDSLMIWNKNLESYVSNQKKIILNKYLRFEDNPYIIPSLNRIRLESNKDISEYGFSQLKLAVCFLHWYNYKENPNELISTPLVLVSVKLAQKKGVKETFELEIIDSVAEINPVLVYQLRELYNIILPEKIDLENQKLEELYETIQKNLQVSNSNIVLELIEKPKIRLIHSKAKQVLNQYLRRNNKSVKQRMHFDLSYSYQQDNFKPLGLEMYKNYIESKQSDLEFLIENQHTNTTNSGELKSNEISQTSYTIDELSTSNRLWQFDLCYVVLGNFNYKKMSLVRDYNEIADSNIDSSLFELIFNNEPRNLNNEAKDIRYDITELYNIVKSDPSQDVSIVEALQNKSYLIQGPPGTGKSQTIANLIANFVAHGKKVLFVCEKRAALDVVFTRLQQENLENLCALIHDSQTDKKDFIMDLKSNYEFHINNELNIDIIESKRELFVKQIQESINALYSYHKVMLENNDSNIRNIELFNRIIELICEIPSEVKDEYIHYPNYIKWENSKKSLDALYRALESVNYTQPFLTHTISNYSLETIQQKLSISEIKKQLETLLDCVERAENEHDLCYIDFRFHDLSELIEKVNKVKELVFLYSIQSIGLCTENSKESEDLNNEIKIAVSFEDKKSEFAEINKNWKTKLSLDEVKTAYELMQQKEGSFFAFLSSNYRNVKKVINNNYNFSAHQIKPKYSVILKNLLDEYELYNDADLHQKAISNKYKGKTTDEVKQIADYWQRNSESDILKWFIANVDSDSFYADCTNFINTIDAFQKYVAILNWRSQLNWISLQETIQALLNTIHDYNFFSPYLLDIINNCDKDIIELLYNKNWSLEEMEAAILYATIENTLKSNKVFETTTADSLQFHIQTIQSLMEDKFAINVLLIKARQGKLFNQILRTSQLSTSGMSAKEKDFKSTIVEARKILENEFSKSTRYKSIRELASSASGSLIRELKPVWLMSPLSVSDTLPIENDFFDVVIFDEASQITLEEGIPPLFRANQTIIVGDKMQMPPSNYFNKKTEEVDSYDEDEFLDDDVQSLLDQSSRKLDSVMLQWHYRSRSENLISYSNAAFYDNQLYTIPDVADHHIAKESIEVNHIDDSLHTYKYVEERPISYHYLTNGEYENRKNDDEAQYIAAIVKNLLVNKTACSIGIIAFSQEQQRNIEDELSKIDFFDKSYEDLLEQQAKSNLSLETIFVKNLENVQGDERDIIILSTCYGRNSKGKMLMNFGPINRKGGEKRLNVCFTRARKHMVVVSSIKHTDITNDYNEGANYFKQYLQYAYLMSEGKSKQASQILTNLSKNQITYESKYNKVIDSISLELSKNGFDVSKNIGQSKFKCHIGVKTNSANNKFDLGIIIDDFTHYESPHIHESYILKPEILKGFDWKVIQVYAKDWYMNKENTINKIKSVLLNEAIETPEIKPNNISDKFLSETFLTKPKESYDFTRLEMIEGTANKFWQIALNNNELIIQYGRIGTDGQNLIKQYQNEKLALYEKKKMISQKEKSGYKLV